MGQFTQLDTQLQALLLAIQAAVPGGALRIYSDPPVQMPGDLPCVFLLTPDEDFQRLDTMTGESTITTVIRCCVDAREGQSQLLALCDTITQVADVWLWNNPPAPLDRARRTGMRGVTPIFGEIATRGADFPIQVQTVQPIQPAP